MQRDAVFGCDRAGKRGERLRGEIGTPAADARDAIRWKSEKRERRSRRHVAGQAEHLRRAPGVAVERRAVQDRHQLREVLREHERRRDRVARFVVLAAQQGRAVRDGEQGEPEARDEERGGDRGVARIACQRRRSEAQRDRAAAARAAKCAQRRRKQTRGDHGGRKDDQGRHQQQERARAAAARQLLRVDGAARPADEDDGDRAERCGVERRDRQPPEMHGGRAHRRVEQQARGDRDTCRSEQAAGREECVLEHVGDRRAGARRDEGGDRSAEHPARNGSGCCE